MDKKKGLGRGLESLFAVYDDVSAENITNVGKEKSKKETGVTELDI